MSLSNEVVWKAIPNSSQELALSCTCSIVLLSGTRGSAKSDTQLMMFRKHIGKGYGQFYRGVIYDISYKGLDDLVSRSKRWFLAFNDGARFLTATSMYKWVWPTGEELLFRSGSTEADYMKDFHGQEFCLAVGEYVCGEYADIRIEDVCVGDRVLTPTGVKRVNKVYPRLRKSCYLVKVFSEDGTLLGQQRQSEGQKFLTISSMTFELLSTELRTRLQFELEFLFLDARRSLLYADLKYKGVFSCSKELPISLSTLAKLIYLLHTLCTSLLGEFRICNPNVHHFCVVLKNLWVVYNSAKDEENYALKLNELRPVFEQLRKQYSLLVPLLQDSHQDDIYLRLSIVYLVCCIFFLLLESCMTVLKKECSGQQQLCELLLLIFCFAKGSAPLGDGLPDLEKAIDCVEHCLLCYDQYGELLPKSLGIYQDIALLPPDVLRCTHQQRRKGAQEDIELRNQETYLELFYTHPYSLQKIQSLVPFQVGRLEAFPCGELFTIDIEVEDSNSFLTPIGMNLRNCFIGGNEITKNPSPVFHDALMSCNRSSFTPEKDSPRDPTTGRIKLLPPIPLQVVNTTNPFGPGRAWVKKQYIDPAPYGKVIRNPIEIISPQTKEKMIVTRSQVTIFSSYVENIHLTAEYIAELHKEKNENKKKAWLYGSWDYVIGGAFSDDWEASIHIVDNFAVPKSWYLDRSFDWGSTHPFDTSWYAVANGEEITLPSGKKFCPVAGSIIMFAEWYGAKKEDWGKNKGLGLSSSAIAQGIVEKESYMRSIGRVSGVIYPGPADNQIGNVIDRASATIAKNMADLGIYWEESDKSPGSRVSGAELFRTRLKASKKKEGPGFYVMRCCEAAIHFIPELKADEKIPDDVSKEQEEHKWDSLRYRILKADNKLASNVPVHFPR